MCTLASVEWNGGGFNGRPLSWSKLERILSGKEVPTPVSVLHTATANPEPKAETTTAFVELHARGSYNFLVGASEPEDLVAEAVRLGMPALGIVDRDGFYGMVKFAEAAGRSGLATVFGAELSVQGPENPPLTVLARGPEGYRRLSRVISAARMAGGDKDSVCYPMLEELAEHASYWLVLADHEWFPALDALIATFGSDSVVLEHRCAMLPVDSDRLAALRVEQQKRGLRAVISGTPNAATREDAGLAAAKNALYLKQSLGEVVGELHPMGSTWLRDAETLWRAVPDASDLIAETLRIAQECAFALNLVAPNLPRWETPEDHTEMSWLRKLTRQRAEIRYRSWPADIQEKAHAQIAYELGVIEKLGFPGYFLIVMDLVDFCRKQDILCQGRGSAANSAVCFALGITAVEPIQAGLLFERFLSPDRDGPPDIDIDIESGRREEVIQYVYDKYGRDNAAQVANVITYRTKGAIRDAGRALGYPQGACDAWSRGVEEPPERVLELAAKFKGQPRHLGIHSGGMVICDRPIADVVPTEWARMEKRSVVQWDKDDCASAGLVKFDLLGLGMLEALHHMIDLVKQHRGRQVNLWELDLADPKVYEMLARADAVGVFQVESRAQMATLPRLKPRCFFDLVVEVALIRPGPIQGGSVHPYIRRRNGQEPVTFDHPCLENALAKTLGIPLFQEQLMQMARDAAGFSGAEADALRRAMGSKRSPAKMAALRSRFYQGLKDTNGIAGSVADNLWNKMVAFAAYGFPESHSQSFAGLVYFSAWFKYYYPAEFCVGLLRAQPMGFYSPQSLIQDARRHGVQILPISVNDSAVEADCPNGEIRLGLNLVSGLGDKAAQRVAANAPYRDIADVARRAELNVPQTEALAKAGAFDCFGVDRRQALWQAGVAATEQEEMLPGLSSISAPSLPGMNAFEMVVADVAATGVTHDTQPMELLRDALNSQDVVPANKLLEPEDGTRIRVAGVVTHRQRPQTASGVTFLGMEDETGLMNVMISPGLWAREKRVARTSKALLIRGIIQNATGAPTLVADRIEPLPIGEWISRGSRDFR
ncbi:error-prone DNA polymerase [Corynebacterium epidermidicanis]|uniref:Error-prone DNA polymerase n=1 Tax=Corynebacterium epidermidicanis TaxID=1050174 RepID=A0A0G3GS76_9CORY|nr:error-prone DNA polymerase [Corynebacterium epidermidicanis]AKK02403.1 error-prone DNA polymerase, DnaE-like [Corynebacterium epidermidicanis]